MRHVFRSKSLIAAGNASNSSAGSRTDPKKTWPLQKKAKAILALRKILIEKYSSQLPSSFEELESLPGIGHKTAGVIICAGFKKPAFPVDTHIFRCAKRWRLSEGRTVEKVEKDLKEIFPKSSWRRLHLQIVLFGRNFCKALNHDKKICPICKQIRF